MPKRKTPTRKRATPVPAASDREVLLSRGVADVVPRQLLLDKLARGERMRIYLGVDPTGPTIHLGHAVILRTLRKFQELGHEIILLVGDFTARIGDPTDRDAARRPMTTAEIRKNAKTYQQQASRILDFSPSSKNPARLDFNARWLAKLTFEDIIDLTSRFTVQQMLERDMFEKRITEGKPISLHEFLYPIMQGYDSVALDTDVEVGGTDQTFNMLTGRTLVKELKKKEKIVMTFELLEGLDGRKMSKSYGNTVGVVDTAQEMYGKLMSLSDDLIVRYFLLCTDTSRDEVKSIERQLKEGANPRDLKMRLAREVVKLYHPKREAEAAEAEFVKVFQQKHAPTEVESYTLKRGDNTLLDVLVNAKLVSSRGEARRLLAQGGVRLDGEKIRNANMRAADLSGRLLQAGKRKFIRIKKH